MLACQLRHRALFSEPFSVQVMEFLGAAAFSKAVQALDLKTDQLVCLKIVNNNKDYFDQSLDEIKLLQYINEADPHDEHNLLRLFDYFYYKVQPCGFVTVLPSLDYLCELRGQADGDHAEQAGHAEQADLAS